MTTYKAISTMTCREDGCGNQNVTVEMPLYWDDDYGPTVICGGIAGYVETSNGEWVEVACNTQITDITLGEPVEVEF